MLGYGCLVELGESVEESWINKLNRLIDFFREEIKLLVKLSGLGKSAPGLERFGRGNYLSLVLGVTVRQNKVNVFGTDLLSNAKPPFYKPDFPTNFSWSIKVGSNRTRTTGRLALARRDVTGVPENAVRDISL
jgi:hypothetical protein